MVMTAAVYGCVRRGGGEGSVCVGVGRRQVCVLGCGPGGGRTRRRVAGVCGHNGRLEVLRQPGNAPVQLHAMHLHAAGVV